MSCYCCIRNNRQNIGHLKLSLTFFDGLPSLICPDDGLVCSFVLKQKETFQRRSIQNFNWAFYRGYLLVFWLKFQNYLTYFGYSAPSCLHSFPKFLFPYDWRYFSFSFSKEYEFNYLKQNQQFCGLENSLFLFYGCFFFIHYCLCIFALLIRQCFSFCYFERLFLHYSSIMIKVWLFWFRKPTLISSSSIYITPAPFQHTFAYPSFPQSPNQLSLYTFIFPQFGFYTLNFPVQLDHSQCTVFAAIVISSTFPQNQLHCCLIYIQFQYHPFYSKLIILFYLFFCYLWSVYQYEPIVMILSHNIIILCLYSHPQCQQSWRVNCCVKLSVFKIDFMIFYGILCLCKVRHEFGSFLIQEIFEYLILNIKFNSTIIIYHQISEVNNCLSNHSSQISQTHTINKMKQNTVIEMCTMLMIIVLSSQSKIIFIDFSQDAEAIVLAKLLLNVQGQYYVDIGAYDPLTISNTANLYIKGWKGVSLEADQQKYKRFKFTKIQQTKLHYAIQNQTKIVTLYHNMAETTATTDQTLQQYIMSTQRIKNQSSSQVCSINMRQLCQRYYLKTPKLMNLDVEGIGATALLGNDWSNSLCRPEVMFIEINDFDDIVNQFKKIQYPQQILVENNYTQFMHVVGPKGWTTNKVFIHNQKLQYYKDYYQQAEKYFQQNYQVYTFNSIQQQIQRQFSNISVGHLYHSFDDEPYYIDLCIEGKPVLIPEIIKFSKMISQNKERPIFLLGFNPLKSVIWMGNLIYRKSQYELGQMNYLKLEILDQQESTEVYILDHRYGNISESQIITNSCLKCQNITQSLNINETIEIPAQNQKLTQQEQIQSLLANKQVNREFVDNQRLNQIQKQNKILLAQNEELKFIIMLLVVIFFLCTAIIIRLCLKIRNRDNQIVNNNDSAIQIQAK